MRFTHLRNKLKNSAAPIIRFAKDKKGNASIIFGLTIIPIVMVTSIAVDYGNSVRIKNELQAATDAGALAAATAIANGEDDDVKEQIGEDTFFANLSDNTLSGFAADPVTEIDFPEKEVTLSVSVRNTRMVSTLLKDHIDINVSATAVVDPGDPICMMALNPTAQGALSINGTADIIADGCSVHVNSDHDEALEQVGSGHATAASFCVHGKYNGSNYTPTPEKDCRQEKDPLAEYFDQYWPATAATTATCDFQSADVFQNGGGGGGQVVLLEPGVYCGDLRISSGDTAILQGGSDGVYVFVDGTVDIRGGGTLRNLVLNSDGVVPNVGEVFPSETVLIFAGNNPGVLEVNGGGNIEIKAKATGTYAGIAVAQPPAPVPNDSHLITGGGTVTIDGIFYTPSAVVDIRGNGVIGADADQFAIMADMIDVRGTGQLEIRIGADYRAAGLPELPEASERVRLVQ